MTKEIQRKSELALGYYLQVFVRVKACIALSVEMRHHGFTKLSTNCPTLVACSSIEAVSHLERILPRS